MFPEEAALGGRDMYLLQVSVASSTRSSFINVFAFH